MTTETTIPTLTTAEEATALLADLAEAHDWVSVFWDRGWGDSGQTAEISIIIDGNGQEPKAYLTDEAYRVLLADKTIPPNSLKTFKARKPHDYKTPPVPEKTGPTPGEVAEQVIRRVLASMPDKPVEAEFYRGLDPHSRYPRVMYEYATTPAYDASGYVDVKPCAFEVIVSAQKPDFLGAHLVGGKATVLAFPRQGDEVDLDALRSDAFRAQLVAVIEDRLAAPATREA